MLLQGLALVSNSASVLWVLFSLKSTATYRRMLLTSDSLIQAFRDESRQGEKGSKLQWVDFLVRYGYDSGLGSSGAHN